MIITATIFNSIFDNKTDRSIRVNSFKAFEKVLYDLSEVPKKSKKDAVLISPATYIEGTTRANKNVLEWAGWCCVDVDDYEFEGDLNLILADNIGKIKKVLDKSDEKIISKKDKKNEIVSDLILEDQFILF